MQSQSSSMTAGLGSWMAISESVLSRASEPGPVLASDRIRLIAVAGCARAQGSLSARSRSSILYPKASNESSFGNMGRRCFTT